MSHKNLTVFGSRFKNTTIALLFLGAQLFTSLASTGLFEAHASAASPTCITDTAGANDQPGQKDLTKLCVDYSAVPTSVATTWNWDETGTNGSNTMDACNLFDNDGNGNVDYSVCVTTTNDPAAMQSYNTYSCGDDKPDRCTQPGSLVSSGNTVCSVSQSNTDPFAAGSSFPMDTQGSCTVDLSTVGSTAAKLVDVCSFPSQQPGSDPSDCVIAQPKAGKLEVKKNLIPGTDSGLFNLQVDGTTKAANIGNNGTTGEIVVPTGAHSVGETAGTNTSLSGYTSSISCRDLNGTGSVIASGNGTSLSNINIADDTDVVCTITNTASGSITIVKDASPDSSQDFAFTATGTGVSGFSLDDDNDPTLSNTKTFTNLGSGTYTFTESSTTDWHLDKIVCSAGTTSVNGATVTINLSAGQNITCTYTNNRDTGSLKLIKHVANSHGGTAVASDFNLHVKQNGVDVIGSPAAGSETGTSYTVTTGAYTVSEDTPVSGYQQTSIICDGQATSSVTVTKDSSKVCTITNTDIAPQLTIIKHVINDNSGTSSASNFTMNVSGTNVSSASFPGSEAGTTVTLNAGNYSVSEGTHTGYNVTMSADCTGTIAINQTKTCTITNNDISHPGINVVKTGPATAHEGDTVTYTFTVTNTGDTNLSGTTVNDDIAGNATYMSGDTNNDHILQKTETWIYKADYTILPNQTADVVNTVTACANDPDQTNVCDTDNHTLDVLHPAITVKKSGPLYGYEGQVIGYTFVVKNTGDTTLHNVNIDDDTANLEHCDNTTLTAGQSTNCTASFLIPTPQTANVVNTVTASGTDSLDRTVTSQDNHTLDVLHPSINVVKTGPATAHEGDTVTYTFTVTNTGDIPLSSVTVDDNIAGAGVYQSGDTHNAGYLDLDETWVYTKDYVIPAHQTANVVNTVKACGLDPIQAADDADTATCDTDQHTLDVLHPAIHVEKSGPANAYEGDSVTYTFTVTNTGDTPLSDVTVGDSITGTASSPSGDTNHNNLLDLTETWVYTANYTIPAPSGDVSNTVEACGTDSLQQNACDTDEHTLHVYHPMITVKKVVVTSQEADDGLFNLQIDGQTAGTGSDVGNGGTTGDILVTPGNHSVSEVAGTDTNLDDYVSSYSKDCSQGTANVSGDEHVTCTITNTRRGSITIIKDAQPDSTQAFKFTGNLTGDDDPNFYLTDDGNGNGTEQRVFAELAPGNYNATEPPVKGWDLTNISCNTESGVNINQRNVVIQLEAGENVICTFTNSSVPPKLTVIKHVVNENGNNAVASDFTMHVDADGVSSSSFPGDEQGTVVTFNPGDYIVSEENLPGYTASFSEEGCSGTLGLGDEATCTITNTSNAPELTITKSNNKPNTTVVGDTVTYTLVVTVPEESGEVFDAEVTDLPPNDFTYVPGSWTAVSSIRGDLKAGDVTTEPTYGSPGIWKLGTLLPGEVITLVYKATIGAHVSNGTYPDLAFVSGTSAPAGGQRVLGNATFADSPFVGTQVSIATPLAPTTFTAGQVLGAEVLVNTGDNLMIAEFILPLMLISGVYVAFRVSSQRKEQS